MNHALILSTLGLLLVLAAIERLAAYAHRRNLAKWHTHYAAIPSTATITAELRWRGDIWVTAYVDPSSVDAASFQVMALRPLSPRDHAACRRWLLAEGFAEATRSPAVDEFSRRLRDAGL
jgi:hypothetical protein